MKPDDFITFVKSLESDSLTWFNPRIIHATLGIAGETREIVDCVKKTIVYDKPLDMLKFKKEIGDLLHYTAILIDSCGWTFEEIMDVNRAKLQKRYPNGFNKIDAILRADKCEQPS